MEKMQIGMFGLGRMGSNMVRRLLKGGHQCVVFKRSPQKIADLVKEGAVGTSSLGLCQPAGHNDSECRAHLDQGRRALLIEEKPTEIGAHLNTFLGQTHSNRRGGSGSTDTETNAAETFRPHEHGNKA